MTRWVLFAAILIGASTAQAAVHTETVEYRDGDIILEGYVAYDDASQEQRPGVLIVHEWKGLGPYVQHRAEMLARLGYVAFAADMYGKGVRAKDHEEAAKLSGVYRADRQLMRRRVSAGLEVLRHHALTDPQRLAAIGYCFGGTSVLELARSGAAILGVVSFHGGLDTPHPEEARHIKAKVLVFQGGDDAFTKDHVPAFEQEMRNAGVDYRLIVYPGAVHSFTVPEAGNEPSQGMAYNAKADHESWEKMKAFFDQLFQLGLQRTAG